LSALRQRSPAEPLSAAPALLATSAGNGQQKFSAGTRDEGDGFILSLILAVCGVVLFFSGFPIIYLNERREVEMWELVGRAEEMCVHDVSADEVDPALEARLVHVSGACTTADTLEDPDFGVRVTGCAKLQRCAEMLQYVETSTTRTEGSGASERRTTEYHYHEVWSSELIDSSRYNNSSYRKNPTEMAVPSELKTAHVTLGAFSLTERLVLEEMTAWEDCTELASQPVTVTVPQGASGDRGLKFAKLSRERMKAPRYPKELPSVFKSGKSTDPTAEPEWYLKSGVFTFSEEVGDIRVHFRKVPCGDCTVVAVQHGSSFAPLAYDMRVEEDKVRRPKHGLKHQTTEAVLDQADSAESFKPDPCGCGTESFCARIAKSMGRKEVYELAESKLSVAKVFELARGDQKSLHAKYSLQGWLCFVIGLFLQLNVFPALLAAVFRSNFIARVGGVIVLVVAIILGSIVFLLTYAACWIVARPVKACLAVGVVVALALLLPYIGTPEADEALKKFL
jgi:hypothetical protein